MSTHEPKRNSSQTQPQSHKSDNSIQPPVQRDTAKRKPLPFDDTGDQGEVVKTTNPNIGGFEG